MESNAMRRVDSKLGNVAQELLLGKLDDVLNLFVVFVGWNAGSAVLPY